MRNEFITSDSESNKSKYLFKNSNSDKTIYVKLNGKFEKQDGLNYMYRYINIIRNINTKKYNLKFDCTNLAVSTNESLKILQECCRMYVAAKFKTIKVIIKPNQSLLYIQLQKLVKNVHLNNVYFLSFSKNIIKLKTPCTKYHYNEIPYIPISSLLYSCYQIYYWFKRQLSLISSISTDS